MAASLSGRRRSITTVEPKCLWRAVKPRSSWRYTEQTFAAHGVPREKADTPLEYLARVLESISVSASSARGLTELYERAKFSPHAIDQTMKDDAIYALTGLRGELEQKGQRSSSAVSSASSSRADG